MNRDIYIVTKCREWQGLMSRIVANGFVRQRVAPLTRTGALLSPGRRPRASLDHYSDIVKKFFLQLVTSVLIG